MKQKVIISWSSGKDSALTLWRLMNDSNYEVVGLYTTHVDNDVPFQATPIAVVKKQAQLIGLPLVLIALPEVFPAHDIYQQTIVDGLKNCGLQFDGIAFGDLFCNGIADYRRQYIEPAGWECVFPLLGQSSLQLANEIIECGIQTKLVTVDSTQLDIKFCGRWLDHQLLSEFPITIDPCGENGEYHSLVVDAPFYQQPLNLAWLERETNTRFCYQRYTLVETESFPDADIAVS
ncbi:ATPase [Photobacterium phosphoreum]|uniref:Dph6-related ATP pyrophosphatase n=1 Tax=Photobacterium phosphoreum TaxID=659 RepID=UPI0005D36AFD|nr:ATPase [Photobacterium phosphoreum]KJF86364.1 ATPase [Photobacterium phosphoreum]MCD9476076.1 ATPase [Photobacterium phosphoreum]MCF2176883.1 ATPase [Photobacterium phosphoreum]PQJ83618.1 ATPase [Photobacterium phosphoreum]PSV69948.1 ATPase [Photobacterium phosphoreum]